MTPARIIGEETNAPEAALGLRILVVDDYPDCAASTAMLLRLYGHEVEVAENGMTSVPQALRFDVVLLDIGLPGIDGWQMAQRITEAALEGRRKPILIAVTGYGSAADERRSAEVGFDRHLLKPVDPKELTELLREIQALRAPAVERPSRNSGLTGQDTHQTTPQKKRRTRGA